MIVRSVLYVIPVVRSGWKYVRGREGRANVARAARVEARHRAALCAPFRATNTFPPASPGSAPKKKRQRMNLHVRAWSCIRAGDRQGSRKPKKSKVQEGGERWW